MWAAKGLGWPKFLHPQSLEADMPCLLTGIVPGAKSPAEPLQPDAKRPCGGMCACVRAPSPLAPGCSHSNKGPCWWGQCSALRTHSGTQVDLFCHLQDKAALHSNLQLMGKEYGDCTWGILTVRSGSGHITSLPLARTHSQGHNSMAREAGK